MKVLINLKNKTKNKMSERVVKIKRLNSQDSPADVESLTETVGANTSTSTNAQIAAKGALTTTASGKLHDARKDMTNKRNAAVASTGVTNSKNEDAVKAYNVLASTVEIENPNDPDAWTEQGFPTTQSVVVELPVPAQVINGSVSNSDFLGTADVHHDPVANTKDYTHRVTKGDPSDDKTYIAVTSPKTQYSKSSCIVDLPADYLNVPLFWKTTAHNTAGAGPESAPYGGGRING